jgi:hypothetical protein
MSGGSSYRCYVRGEPAPWWLRTDVVAQWCAGSSRDFVEGDVGGGCALSVVRWAIETAIAESCDDAPNGRPRPPPHRVTPGV